MTTPSHNSKANTYRPQILVFDSGVGGLSVLQAIQQQYPQCQYSYVSDNAAFPYGTKSEDELVFRVDKVLDQLQNQLNPDIIVIACNTASTVALPHIRQRFIAPIIGVVPAIKPAAQISQTKTLGLLATPGTITRPYTQQLIDEFAHHCKIIRIGSSDLVHISESKLQGGSVDREQLKTILEPFKQEHTLDTIILACTHFPLLKDELKEALPHISHWIDSGEAIARRVGYWLNELDLTQGTQSDPAITAYFTQEDERINHMQVTLNQLGIQHSVVCPVPY